MGSPYQAPPLSRVSDLLVEKRLPVQVVPLPDELFSSWFFRSARANGMRIHQLEISLLPRGRPLFAGDPTRGVWCDHGHALALAMGLSEKHADGTFMNAYVGNLWASVPNHGVWQHVLSVADANHKNSTHGLQFCPECLRTDKEPYFRKHWRLAFCVVCDLHRCRLLDHCPHCGVPVVLQKVQAHTRRIFDCRLITECFSCGESLIRNQTLIGAGSAVSEFQKTFLMTLQRGWVIIERRSVHSILFFQAIRILLSLVDQARHNKAALQRNLAGRGNRSSSNRYGGYEANRLQVRNELMVKVCYLLRHGPQAMAKSFARWGVNSNDLNRLHRGSSKTVPFWLWEPMHFNIDRTPYIPSADEIYAAVRYANATKESYTTADICRLLNLRSTSNARVADCVKHMQDRASCN